MIQYIKIGDTHKVDVDIAAKTYLKTYNTCPRCGYSNPKIKEASLHPMVKHHSIHVYNKWYLGLFRTTKISTNESWCEKCGTKWQETQTVKGELTWRPIRKCAIYWIVLLISLCIAIPTLAWCIHVIGIPEVERDISAGKFALVLFLGLSAMFLIILSIVRISIKTIRQNRWNMDK